MLHVHLARRRERRAAAVGTIPGDRLSRLAFDACRPLTSLVTARLRHAGFPPDAPSPHRPEPREARSDVFSRIEPARCPRGQVERSLGARRSSVGARVIEPLRSPRCPSTFVLDTTGTPFSRRWLRCFVRHHPRAGFRQRFEAVLELDRPGPALERTRPPGRRAFRNRVGAVRRRSRSLSTDVCNPLFRCLSTTLFSKNGRPMRLGALRVAFPRDSGALGPRR